jgi:glycosyltransferase involved in cell wall biosynthesis
LGVADGIWGLPRSTADELRVGGEAALGACLPREPLEKAFASVSSQSLRKRSSSQNLCEAFPKLCDVPRLDEKASDAVLDYFGKPAKAARDDGCPARHRLDDREAKKLRDRDLTPIARHIEGRKSEDLRTPEEGGEVGVRDGAEELDTALRGKRAEQFRIIAFGRVGVVPGRADHAQFGVLGERLDQAVDALVRREASNEEDAATASVRVGPEASGIGPSIDDPRSRRRRREFARRIGRYREKAVEKPREKPGPIPATEAVVGDGGGDPADTRMEGRQPAGRASQLVRMDDVGAGKGMTEPGRERMGRMAAEEGDRAQDTDAQAAGIAPRARFPGEADELAIDLTRKRASELERIALTAPEDPGRAEERGRDVNHPHLVLPLITLGDPHRLSGGYLYHLRMAEAAPAHEARIRFLSFPEWPFPLAALRGPAMLRWTEELRASAVLLDSIAAAFTGPALAKRSLGVPLIAVLHQPPGGIDHSTVRAWGQAPLDRLALRRADLLLAASDHLAKQLVEAGLAESRIRVVPPGRDVASPPEGPVRALRNGRQAAFLSVANWLPRKGILELLEAFARLPSNAGTLHLVGDETADARYRARVRSRLAQRDLIGRVITHGPVPLKEVAALYTAADVFVLPASREPYGTVWGEAMAFGLPVVGWRAGNLPYLAEDRREGLLVEPGDIDALSEALTLLALDGDMRARLGAAAKRRALSRPTWEASAALFFAAIRGVVDRGTATHQSETP